MVLKGSIVKLQWTTNELLGVHENIDICANIFILNLPTVASLWLVCLFLNGV